MDLFQDDQTFHLIRLPKETIERCKQQQQSTVELGGKSVGTLIVTQGQIEFQDSETLKQYELIINSKKVKGQNELIQLETDKKEATYLGKVLANPLIAVPKK